MASKFRKGDMARVKANVSAVSKGGEGLLPDIPVGAMVSIVDRARRGGWRYQVKHDGLLVWLTEEQLLLPLEATP
jgi:hypothetical protein